MELLHIHLTELTLLLHVIIDMQTLKRQVSKLYFFRDLKVLIWGCITGFCCRLAGIPRPIWMAIANGGLLIAHLLFARALPGSMYAASILTGLCSGIQWTLIGPTISELFGLKHFGLIYGTICSASALGSLLFSSLVGHLYDHECQKETYIGNTVLLTKEATAVLSFSSSSSSFSRLTLTRSFLQKAAAAAETTCLGAHCFKLAFFIMAVVCLVGVFINLTLAARTRNLYQSLHKLHSSTTTFSDDDDGDDDDDDDYNCEDKGDSDPILPHWNTVISQHPPTFQCFFDQPRKANLVFESCLFPICLHQKVDQSIACWSNPDLIERFFSPPRQLLVSWSGLLYWSFCLDTHPIMYLWTQLNFIVLTGFGVSGLVPTGDIDNFQHMTIVELDFEGWHLQLVNTQRIWMRWRLKYTEIHSIPQVSGGGVTLSCASQTWILGWSCTKLVLLTFVESRFLQNLYSKIRV